MATEIWWNVFASKACQFLRALGSVMVLIVLGLIGLTYYTTAWEPCILQLSTLFSST